MSVSKLTRIIILFLLISPAVLANNKNAETLDKYGISEIVFADRTYAHDGHWYANFGYRWDGQALYGEKGRLCKLNVATNEVITLIDDPSG